MNTINNGEETVTVSYNKSKSTNFPFIQKGISNTKLMILNNSLSYCNEKAVSENLSIQPLSLFHLIIIRSSVASQKSATFIRFFPASCKVSTLIKPSFTAT